MAKFWKINPKIRGVFCFSNGQQGLKNYWEKGGDDLLMLAPHPHPPPPPPPPTPPTPHPKKKKKKCDDTWNIFSMQHITQI